MPDMRRQTAANAWGALLRVHATLVPRLDQEMLRASGLPLSWYDVLLELYGAPASRLQMGTLAESVTLSRTRVSRIVNDMYDAGLVAREENPDDGRSAFAVLTDAGRTRFRRAAPGYLRGIESGFAKNLSNAELRQLADLLSRIVG